MATATGAQRRISHVKESSWKTPSGTAFQIDRVLKDGGGSFDRDSWMSDELRADRGVANVRMGVVKPKFSLPFELSYGTQDDFMESAFYSAWVAAGTPATGLSVTVVAGTTNTMAATGIDTGLSVGDRIKVSGFTGGYTANNGFFKVTAKASGVITLGEAKDISGNSTLAACSAQSNITVTRMGYLVTGTTEKSLAFEEAFTDISVFAEYLGCIASGMSLSVPQTGIIKGAFDFIGGSVVGPAGTTYTGSTIAATTTSPMDGASAGMTIKIDGALSAIVTNIDLNLSNNSDFRLAAFQSAPIGVKVGRSNLSGSMGLYFQSSAYWTKYVNETAVALGMHLMDSAGATGYSIDIPNVKITAFPKPQMEENDSVQNISFQALPDSTSGLVNWRIWKLA